MNGWNRGNLISAASTAHTARVAAAVEAARPGANLEFSYRPGGGLAGGRAGLVALGLARGHFEGGQLCAGHFASGHQDQAAGLDGHILTDHGGGEVVGGLAVEDAGQLDGGQD